MRAAGWERRGAVSRLLLVGLLFVSISRSVLDVGGARAEPVQVAAVLRIVNVILEEHLWEELQERRREQTRAHVKHLFTASRSKQSRTSDPLHDELFCSTGNYSETTGKKPKQ